MKRTSSILTVAFLTLTLLPLDAFAAHGDRRVGRLLDDEVKAYARANGYDLILPEALYAAPALDVTEAILQAMSRKAAAAPAASRPAAAPAATKPPASAPAK